ncbi:Spliceosome-associated protein 49 [Savitreella phatthalungensis]
MLKARRNQETTIYCGNLDANVREDLLFELMVQAGAVVSVHMPKDKVMGTHSGYGFVEFLTRRDAEYATGILAGVKLFGRPLKINFAGDKDRQAVAAATAAAAGNTDHTASAAIVSDRVQAVESIGAELFIGGLDPLADERLLVETFSGFGTLLRMPRVVRGEGDRLGKGFVSYASFDAADAAITAMDRQFLANRPITVGYAFKQGSATEKHGSQAERLLAQRAIENGVRVVPLHPVDSGSGMVGARTGANALPTKSSTLPQGFTAATTNVNGYSTVPAPPPPPGTRR